MSIARVPAEQPATPAVTALEPALDRSLGVLRPLAPVPPVNPVTSVGPVTSVEPVEVLAHGRVRRSLEVLVAATALLVLAPLLLLLAVLVVGTSRGPVLYRQQRVGAGGRPFEILKLRSMRQGAEREADALFARRNDASGPLHKLHRDPRATAVGRLLRRFSLDELPQLWNVLDGSMALVGPRPATPAEVACFAPREHRRHAVRPGITGLAQVNGRSDLDWERSVDLDLHYVENRSLRLDLTILLRTLPAILRGRGAY